jgi:hypothetical protein
MRINIYDHEIPFMANQTAEIVVKEAEGIEYYGIRFYTEEPRIHANPEDNDAAAITLWVPHSKSKGTDTQHIENIAHQLLARCREINAK